MNIIRLTRSSEKEKFLLEIQKVSERIYEILEKETRDLEFWTELFQKRVRKIISSNLSASLNVNSIILKILKKYC